MPIPQEISDILTELGGPTAAIGLAVGLVKGAKALEKSASEAALKSISDLLLHGNMANVGKLGATLIPVIFDRVFGPKPVSVKFISRSIFATVLFWLLLLTLKHADWGFVWEEFLSNSGWELVVPMWLTVDWISLTKARYLLKIMSTKYALTSMILFFFFDIVASYLMPFIASAMLYGIAYVFSQPNPGGFWRVANAYLHLEPISQYFIHQGNNMSLNSVLIPSTLLTSLWTLLLVLTFFIVKLLIPLETLRRLTAFWFRDVEKYPLTSIAKVAATLIIAGATVIKVIRWV